MDITPDVAYLATFPTTALTEPLPVPWSSYGTAAQHQPSWDDSSLNPKNRIDSLAPVTDPKWRIDGCTRMATQFYTIPTFIQPLVPLRIDTFIPPRAQWPPELIEALQIDRAFLYYDARIVHFGIAQHILRTLEHWTSEFPDFETYYTNLPFGSRIVFEDIAKDVRQIQVRVVPMHSLERELLSLATLQAMWPDITLPPTLDITQLELRQQIHDSISLVRPRPRKDDDNNNENNNSSNNNNNNENMILKALILSPKYLYHELHILLTLPPHPNIHPRPLHLVTKRCRFGGKTGVLGFTTAYHARGTLRDVLPLRREPLKWARQLTDALLHLQRHGQYHCDLRLDNVLLTDADDALLIDFEHRGIPASGAAPEVRCLEYVDLLKRYTRSFGRLVAQHVAPPPLGAEAAVYRAGDRGYYAPWLCLGERGREAAEVYLLGRVLWCVFEGVSAPAAMLGVEYVWESDVEFPEFRRTPVALRILLLRCTSGWTPWLGGLARRGRRLGFGRDEDSGMTAPEVVDKIAACCREELERAEDFLKMWDERRKQGDENIFNRPRLKEIAQALSDFQSSLAKDLLG